MGLKTQKELGDMFLIVGHTDDGVKHWIHYDAEKQKYYPRNQKIGACAWHGHQTFEVIRFLLSDETLSIRKYEAEKLEDGKKE